LGKIARKYHTSVRKIKRWNHLRSNKLRIGQKLKIYSRYAVATSGVKKKRTSKKNNKKTTKQPKGKYVTYKVKQGDTLWNISRKFNVSLSELLKWNQMKANQKLKPGMKLKIYKS